MKKFFYVLMAAAALVAVSCEKNPNEENKNEGEDNTTPKKTLTKIASELNEDYEFLYGYSFTYGEDGKLASVYEVGDWGEYNLNVVWNGNTVTFKEDANDEYPEGKVVYTWTIGSNGYVSKCVKGDSVYSYEYDADNHLVKVFEDWGEGNQLVSQCTWENGNMTSWTKEKELENEETGEKYARVKRQTYKEDVNVAGIFTAFSEKGNLKKWMFSLNFFGKASAQLVATDKWDDAEKDAKFEYRTDDDDYVVAEVKYYMNDDLTTYKLDDESYYFWE